MAASVTATFLFTDLVDSTATSARLGPEAAEELRQTHFRLLRGALSASGGAEVKNLGDGLMVMYSSPSRALAGAVGIQQAIEHHNRSAPEPLDVRVGVSAGEAIEEDDDYFGDPVVEAARLCAAAQGGQILAAELVRLMVGRHAAQTFVDLGPLELKGLPEPLPAVEVVWEPIQVAGSVPLPGRLVGAAADALFGFFGRSGEVALLDAARKQAHATRRCQVVFVAGEAGMGKTALVAQVARSAHGDASIVLFGHSDEDVGISYQPWIELVATLVREGDPEVLAALRPAQRSALARLVPEASADEERVADPDTERLLLWEGTTELLAAASQSASVLVVLDDLHWADTATLQLLRHVVSSTTPMDVTMACTYRDTDLLRGDPLTKLLADMHREANVTRIPLGGLEDNEVVELISAAAGHELDDDGVSLAHALRRETDGNPFFTAELLRHLGETGNIVLGDDGRWHLAGELNELGLPSSVRDVVGRRVERLGEEALRVLCLAAVMGREFDVDLLARLADVDEDLLVDLLDAGVVAAVLVEASVGDRYRFAHALIQHSLYDELSPARRQRAHQRIAEALEARTEDNDADAAMLAELAHHWVAAIRPAQLDKALGYVRRAGDAARDALAPDDAIRWYEQALDLLERQTTSSDQERVPLLTALGTVQRLAGRPEYRATLLDAAVLAERLDDTEGLVRVALEYPIGPAMVGDEDTKRVAAAALQRIGTDARAERAQLLAVFAGAHDGTLEWKQRRDLSVEALDAARESDDDVTFVDVSIATHLVLATPDRRTQSFDDAEQAVAFADRIGDPVRQTRARYYLQGCSYQSADLAAADRLLAEMEALVDRVGLPYQRYELGGVRCGRLLLAGRASEAEAEIERVLAVGTAVGIADAFSSFSGFLLNVRRHQGRLDEVVDFFADVARDNPSIAALRAAVPAMLCEVGRIDEARSLLDREFANDFDLPYDQTWLMGMSRFLDAAATTGHRSAARTLVDRVAPYASHVIAPAGAWVIGATARPLARAATILEDYDQAEAWFAIAHDLHARLQAPFFISLAQLDHADLCLARRNNGDLERARELANTAASTAARYGCAGLTRRAAQLLAQT